VSFEISKNLRKITDFTIHVVVGSIEFVIVFGAAVIISIIVKAFDGIVPHWVEATGEYAEMALFGIDLFCFGLFVVAEAISLIRGLWRE
jgi:hypothetical protein